MELCILIDIISYIRSILYHNQVIKIITGTKPSDEIYWHGSMWMDGVFILLFEGIKLKVVKQCKYTVAEEVCPKRQNSFRNNWYTDWNSGY